MNKTATIRSQARRAALVKSADSSFGNAAGEFIGHTGGNIATLSLLGGLLGKEKGAMIGAAAGALGVPLGGLGALLTSRRTAAEQAAWDSNSHFARNMLVPGSASYNLWKRIGRIIGSSSEKAKKSAEANESAAAVQEAYVAGFCKAAEAMGVDPGALAKAADGVSDWVNANLPDYTPGERLVQELKAKKDRGIDIEKYRTSDVGNWAGMLGGSTVAALGIPTVGLIHAGNDGSGLGTARGWIKHLRKFAPVASARHPGVTKAIGRLLNTGVKGGAYALPLLAGLAVAGKFHNRRAVNKAIDQVQGSKK